MISGLEPSLTQDAPVPHISMQHFGIFCRDILHFEDYYLRKYRELLEILSNSSNKYVVLIAEIKSTHRELHFAGSESKIHRVGVDKSPFTHFTKKWQFFVGFWKTCVLSL